MLILQAIINGLFTGALYGLIAMGLTLIFGVMKIINFAHGSLITIAMFCTYGFTIFTGLNLYYSVIVVCPVLFTIGYLIQKYLINSVLISEIDIREPIQVLLLTSGLWIFLDNMIVLVFGPDYHTVKEPFSSMSWFLADTILINKAKLLAFLVSCSVAFILLGFLNWTEPGRAIKAVGQDRQMSSLLGINTNSTFNLAFGLGAVIAGIGGIMLSAFYYVQPNMGVLFGIKSFIIVVLGGLGSIMVGLVAGISVGLRE